MEQIKHTESIEFKYVTMVEMTQHVAAMGITGWSLIYSSELTLHVIYRKNI